jgi:hypothetical protein
MPGDSNNALEDFIFEPRVQMRSPPKGTRSQLPEEKSSLIILNKCEAPRSGSQTLQGRYMASY